MKKLILILATASLALNGFAGNDDDTKNKKKDPDKYCAEFRDGVLKVIHNGDVMTEDVTLANGTKVHTDATIERKDGSVSVMKDGQCIDLEGNTDESNFGNQPGENKGMEKKSDVNKNKAGETDYDKGDMNKSDKDKDKMKKSDKTKSDKTKTDKKKDRKSDKDSDDDNDTPLLDRPDHER